VDTFDPQPQLNRLHHQVARLRSIALALAVATVTLVAVTVVGLVRKPSTIVIRDGDDELSLTADGIQIKSPLGTMAMSASTAQLRDTNGRYTAVDAARVAVSDGSSMATLSAGPGNAELSMIGGNRGLGSFFVGDTESRATVSASGNSAGMVANKDGVQFPGR
jgi:hypothetical protein